MRFCVCVLLLFFLPSGSEKTRNQDFKKTVYLIDPDSNNMYNNENINNNVLDTLVRST